jgi:hypothetical protein
MAHKLLNGTNVVDGWQVRTWGTSTEVLIVLSDLKCASSMVISRHSGTETICNEDAFAIAVVPDVSHGLLMQSLASRFPVEVTLQTGPLKCLCNPEVKP